MTAERMVVVVEEVEAAKTALLWALRNVIRSGDIVTLLYVYPTPYSGCKNMQHSIIKTTDQRLLRLKGFHLALSFKNLCDQIKVDIVVKEGEEGPTIVSIVRKIRASALILGLHNQSFLCRILRSKGTSNFCIKNADCRILAVKHAKCARTWFTRNAKMDSEIQILHYSFTDIADQWSH